MAYNIFIYVVLLLTSEERAVLFLIYSQSQFIISRTKMENKTTLKNWFPEVMLMEGTWADRPLKDDPGGKTMRGVTEQTFYHAVDSGILPNHVKTIDSLKTLSRFDAEKVAQVMFFDAFGFDKIRHESIAIWLFEVRWGGDANGYSVKKMQSWLNLNPDGDVGPKTIAAINKLNAVELMHLNDALLEIRFMYLRSLSNWEVNKNGWSMRLRRWHDFYKNR